MECFTTIRPNGAIMVLSITGRNVRNVSAQIFLALLLSLCAFAQTQGHEGAIQNERPPALKVITDPAEYEAFTTAINTPGGLESRQAALKGFLRRFPNSVMREDVLDALLEIMVRLDNERTARARAELRYRRIRGAALARNLPSPQHDLNFYAPCRLGQFEMHEAPEDDKPFYRTVSTPEGERKIEVMHRINFYIAYGGIPLVNFKAERLGNNYAQDKQALIDGLRMLGEEPDTDMATPWPAAIGGFEVYGINRRQLLGMVLGAYLLLRRCRYDRHNALSDEQFA